MGLSQSLYTGYSGLVTHQRALDNTSNNLANVNTVGYKSATFMFSNLMKKSIVGSLPEGDNKGSTNGINLGLGVTTGAILNNFTQGAPDITNEPLDCCIDGNGFFVVKTGNGSTALTRNGDFWLDSHESSGRRMLVVGDGLPVQGWMAQNGSISPSSSTTNIYLPSVGDMLAGETTKSATIGGVLPTVTTGSDFTGNETTRLELNGNLSADGQSLNTSIYASVTSVAADGTTSTSIQEIPVTVQFSGPTLSADGAANQWTWTMSTVNYPNDGDSVQIYPAQGDTNFSQGALNFHTTSSYANNHGAGQSVSDTVKPGSSAVSHTSADGSSVSFKISSAFTVDVSRLTNMDGAPVDNGVETWFVNGNPTGTMVRTMTIHDELTEFIQNENGTVSAERRVAERSATIIFDQSAQDSAGTTWTWTSSAGGTGELHFNTQGELDSSSQSGGDVQFQWENLRYAPMDASLTMSAQDGFVDGYLEDISFDDNGVIWGSYDNKVNVPLAQIAIGTVGNLNGLSGSSGTLFHATSASGAITIGVANDSSDSVPSLGLGSIMGGALESSNVDMSKEFTTMISIERGYQFNSRVVTTADEMLQTAIGLKT